MTNKTPLFDQNNLSPVNNPYRDRIIFLPEAIPAPLAGLWDTNASKGLDVAMIVTNKCKSACAHCYNNSGPKGDSEISSHKVRQLIDQGSFHNTPISRIGFSGGEPLFYDSLIELSEECVKQGINVSCITGGIGVETSQLVQLADTGMTRLTFSFDKYHNKFLNEGELVHMINSVADLFPEIALQVSSTSIDDGLSLAIRLAANTNERVQIAIMPVTGVGRATRLIGAKKPMGSHEESIAPSDAISHSTKITINYDEWVYANCRLDGLNENMQICHLDDLLIH
ncbi:MAG: radical SAM protein [Candidatus Thiodiazotropha sp.]